MKYRMVGIVLLCFTWQAAWGIAPISIAVSIPPQIEFVKEIGKGYVDVFCLLPPGASDELFEPSVLQLKKMSKAQLYFEIGTLPLETHYRPTWRSLNPKLRIIDTSLKVPRLKDDPHLWMSPRRVQIQVETITQALIDVDPIHRAFYLHNKANYLKKLRDLDSHITARLSGNTPKAFLIFHPVLGYFSDDYGLTQMAIEEEGKSPTPRQLNAVLKRARHDHITLVLVEKQSGTELASTVVEAIQGRLLVFDPMDKDYCQGLEKLSRLFRGQY